MHIGFPVFLTCAQISLSRRDFARISEGRSVPNPRAHPFVSKDKRRREAEIEKERKRKRTAYAKKKAELLEYKRALKDLSASKVGQ